MRYLPFIAIAAAFGLVGCKHTSVPAAPEDPVNFLKWSMDRYAEMPDMQASASVETSTGKGQPSEQIRTFRYQSPNKYRVQSKDGTGVQLVCVSDGSQEADYDNKSQQDAVNGPSPATISGASSPYMVDPSLCGSLIYNFFGGSANYMKLVKGPVNFVGEGTGPNGEPVKMLSFNTPGLIGDVKAAIGSKTGYVYALSYDFGGAKAKIQQKLGAIKEEAVKSDPKATGKIVDDQVKQLLQTKFNETYMNIRVGMKLSPGSFDPAIPGATSLLALGVSSPSSEPSPIPLDQPAPDVTVKTLDGKAVRLSELKGHPVFIDFWATWCGPCKQSLPETAEFARRGAAAGLVVLPVSNEDSSTVKTFLSQQNYKLNAVIDGGGVAEKAFKVNAWPTQVFIDAKGNVSDYIVGYEPALSPPMIRAALLKIGYKPAD